MAEAKTAKKYYLGTGRRKTAVARVRLAGAGPEPGRATAPLRLPDPRRPHEGAQEVRPQGRPQVVPVLEALSNQASDHKAHPLQRVGFLHSPPPLDPQHQLPEPACHAVRV